MVELVDAQQLSKATERAKAGKLFVQPSTIFRQYHVTNRETGAKYTVDFFVRNGKRYGHCTCKCGIAGKHICKHIAAAAGLHVMRASQRRQSERLAA